MTNKRKDEYPRCKTCPFNIPQRNCIYCVRDKNLTPKEAHL